MRFVEFFAGIGGFRVGMEAAGHQYIAHSEIEPYACSAYQRRFPGSINLGDVGTIPSGLLRQLDADCWCGGFPCQPFSAAGARRVERDNRNLWPILYRHIRLVRPRVVYLENVPGLQAPQATKVLGQIARLVLFGSVRQRVETFLHRASYFGRILGDLAEAGYVVEWAVISAEDIGAPHLRKRVWIVAHADCGRRPHQELRTGREQPRPSGAELERAGGLGRTENQVPDAESLGRGSRCRETQATALGERRSSDMGAPAPDPNPDSDCGGRALVRQPQQPEEQLQRRSEPDGLRPTGPTGPAVPGEERSLRHAEEQGLEEWSRLQEGRPYPGLARAGWWATEPDVGRVAHGISSRVDRLKCLGNAVVPANIYWIARRLR